MGIATRFRGMSTGFAMACALACALHTPAAAAPLRAPQIPLQTGWDGVSLQSYMNSIGEGMNTLTDQLDLQTWEAPGTGNATFQLKMEIAGYAGQNNIGIYNAAEISPTLYQVFPGSAAPGWHATCLFTSGGGLTVQLFDGSNALQSTTVYTGVAIDNFGFYLAGPGGTFYSQDARNAGGRPQVVAYAGTGVYSGRWWECFEDLPYAQSNVDFQDSILLLDSIQPTPIRGNSWGALKQLYR